MKSVSSVNLKSPPSLEAKLSPTNVFNVSFELFFQKKRKQIPAILSVLSSVTQQTRSIMKTKMEIFWYQAVPSFLPSIQR